jgi:hypothetical protein
VHPCPCCGYEVFPEPAGSYDICPICFWEDDVVQLAFPDMAGGANHCSLIEGQKNYAELGACERRLRGNVRTRRESDVRNASWRPLEPQRDRYLRWSAPEDRKLWETVKDSRMLCLYYWSPEYWLAKQNPRVG